MRQPVSFHAQTSTHLNPGRETTNALLKPAMQWILLPSAANSLPCNEASSGTFVCNSKQWVATRAVQNHFLTPKAPSYKPHLEALSLSFSKRWDDFGSTSQQRRSNIGPTFWTDVGPTLAQHRADFHQSLSQLCADLGPTLGHFRADF